MQSFLQQIQQSFIIDASATMEGSIFFALVYTNSNAYSNERGIEK